MPCSGIFLMSTFVIVAQIQINDCRRYSKTNTTDQSGFLMSWSSSGSKLLHVKDIPVSMCLANHAANPHSHKRTKELQYSKCGNNTKSVQKVHGYDIGDIKLPISETKRIIISEGDRYQGTRRDNHLLFTVVNYPHNTFTILEPGRPGGCQNNTMYTVMETAKQKDCIVAVNGGFFENTGYFGDHIPCLAHSLVLPEPKSFGSRSMTLKEPGTTFSDGRLAADFSGAQNAHFGITKDGHLHVGYLAKADIQTGQYEELIGGVFWIIRDTEVYITESINIECQDEEQAETMTLHANTVSARTAVGHDKDGRVLIMQVDGRTGQTGFTLYEFASVLLDYGFVQAINLDGGGSATYVVNGIVANYPSDKCKNDERFNCARNVSTVLCVHQPEIFPYNRSNHNVHATFNQGLKASCDKNSSTSCGRE